MKKKISMRLYRMHDLDLIALFLYENRSFRKIMRAALEEYALEGVLSSVAIPELPPIIHMKKVMYCIPFQLTLDEELDREVIELLKNIPKGMRNSFLKNLMRQKINNSTILQVYQNPLSVVPAEAGRLQVELDEKKSIKKKKEITPKKKTKKETIVFQKEDQQDSQSTNFLSQFVDLIR